jgi:hypothetical protein
LVKWIVPLALLLGACTVTPPTPRVDPERYDAFWLWPGVRPIPAMARARTIYLLGGEIRRGSPDRIVPLRATPHVRHATIWLVYRAESLDWGPQVVPAMRATLARWRGAGNRVEGIQIDFDSGTRGLSGYAAFLRHLRSNLPADAKLSVTGLLDGAANGDPAALTSLNGVVDELVIQTYQGTTTVADIDNYLPRLARVPVPFKLGLVEGGEWREPAGLRANARFRGYVVFVLGEQN